MNLEIRRRKGETYIHFLSDEETKALLTERVNK